MVRAAPVFTHPCFLCDKQILKAGINEGKWTGINTKHTHACPHRFSDWGATQYLDNYKMITCENNLNEAFSGFWCVQFCSDDTLKNIL